jgi:hypothetical protein
VNSSFANACRVLTVTAALLVPVITLAQDPVVPAGPPKVARGIVTALDSNTLTLKSADGQTRTVALAKDWTVSLLKPLDVATIQPGSFIGTAEMPLKEGTGRSLEVHVFPPGVKMGEGHYDWDLRPGSKMTNGTVGKVTTRAKGRELQVEYPGGERHLVVPNGIPVVQITDGNRSLVKPGLPVFVMMVRTPDGEYAAIAVAVGEDGTKPPM